MFTLSDLDKIIASRASVSDGSSYTASLLDGGIDKCAKKFGEEAVETVIAAASGNCEELTKESADLLFHLLVLLKAGGVSLDAVMGELEIRTARSGIEEKASRGS